VYLPRDIPLHMGRIQVAAAAPNILNPDPSNSEAWI
jgi:hypothetical protein